MKTAFTCALLAVLTWMGVEGALFIRAATEAARALPLAVVMELRVSREKVLAEVDQQASGLRADLTGQVAAARQQILTRADSQITALSTAVMDQAALTRDAADQRLGETLARVDTALALVKPALDGAAAAELSATRVLDGATAMEAHLDKTVVDLHPQLLGLVAATKVTMGETAQTMREVKNAAPEISESVKTTAAAVAREADAITKPQKWWQKILGPVYTAAKLTALFM